MPAKTRSGDQAARVLRLRLLWARSSSRAVGVAPSTVHRVLRCRLNRLAHVDRATGEPVRRYEHPHPGAMLHVDVKKLGNIPDGGGLRFVGRAQGGRNRAATRTSPRTRYSNRKMGTAFVHTVIDDHSRVAYAEVHDDETAATATAVLATPWPGSPARHHRRAGAVRQRLRLRSHLWRDVCAELGHQALPHPTLPAQTNGKIERFHRTMSDGWGYAAATSETERREALPAWLHEYNHHRHHTACGNKPPITRLINLPGQYS